MSDSLMTRFRGRNEQASQVLIKHAVDYVKIVMESWASASVGVSPPMPLERADPLARNR
jgi:hypothetical protein